MVEDEPELDEPELDEPELVDPEPVDPDVPELLDVGDVVELELELDVPFELVVPLFPVPEFGVVELVVAALATSAPPPTRPAVSAPMASTLRGRNFISFVCPSFRVMPTPSGGHDRACAPDL